MALQTNIVDFLNKIGIDKALHFLVGGWMVSFGFTFGIIGGIIMFLALIVLAFLKEKVVDKEPDWKDFWFSIAGGVVSIALFIPVLLLL